MFYFAIAMLTAGAAFVAGLLSLFIGFNKMGEKADLVFGLMALCLFIFIVLPPTGFILEDKPPYPIEVEIKRIFSWSYYIFLAWFIEYYSGYGKRKFVIAINVLTVISYFAMISTSEGSLNPVWRVLIIIPLTMILLYGLLSAKYMFTQKNRKEGQWLLVAMLVYGFLYLITLINTFNSRFIEELLGSKIFFPLHLNYLAFIIIMSLRLQKNAYNKYRLEKIIRINNKQWDTLLYNIQLLIIEIDKEGKIVYVNPYMIKKLGYQSGEEILGIDWFQNFIPAPDLVKRKSKFLEAIDSSLTTKNEKSNIKTRLGEERIINWTSVLVTDDNGETKGTLCVGMDNTDLENAFRQVQDLKNELEKENLFLREVVSENIDHEIIGKSEAIIYTIQKARQVSPTNATVLLEGETGVGKELFANLIHKSGLRSDKPLIKVNCAALPPELIESELFGHEKGSFTGAVQTRKGRFELADGGTIFLDEIGEMPITLQPKLLRVLQSGEFERIGGQTTLKVDVRVISATNRDLMHDVKAGRFREDLFYRLNVYPITVPSLRNRKEDIPLLVDHFIKKYALEFNKHIENISRADLNRLIEYSWPGNIRELINLIERSIITSNSETLKVNWEQNHQYSNMDEHPGLSSIKELEKEHILRILKECNGKINGPEGAAERLGINPNTLRSRMKKLNITRD